MSSLKRFLRLLPATLYVLLVFAFIFLPVVTLVLFSFQGSRLPIPPFDGPSLKWYGAVFSDRRLMAALNHSIWVGVLSSLLAVALAFLAAYALARVKLPLSNLWRWLITAPLSMSYLIIAMGLLITFNALGIAKSLVAIGIGHVVINLPLCFAIIFSQLGEQQARLERAARDLGASELSVMTLITLPLIWPALFAAFFLSFTLSWDEFIIAFLLSRFDVTLPVEIWSLLSSGLNPKTNAIGSVVFGVSIVLLILLETILLGRRRRT